MIKELNKGEILYLKRCSAKPYPIKGGWAIFNDKSPATHASIQINVDGYYEVNVWDLRGDSAWNESSWGRTIFVKLNTLKEAKIWLVENYGGKWSKE